MATATVEQREWKVVPDRKTITVVDQRSKTDYNLYEGTEVSGDVDTVLVRGTVVVDDDELRVEPGFGELVERAKFGEELHAAPATA
jgi:hypothetical protein